MRLPLTVPESERLIDVHARLRGRHSLAWRLEGDYVDYKSLERVTAKGIWQGVVQVDLFEQLSADNILAIRRFGITMHGPPPSKVLPRVSRRLLKETMLAFLQQYRDRYEVSPQRPVHKMTNDLLNACRCLYVLRTGRLISKSEGAHWALANLDPRWHPAIAAAAAHRIGRPPTDAEKVLTDSLRGLTQELWLIATRTGRSKRKELIT